MSLTSSAAPSARPGVSPYLRATVLGTFGFLLGTMMAGAVLPALGVPAPDLPAGVEQGPLFLWMMAAAGILALALSFLAACMGGTGVGRWALLTLLVWVALGPVNALEAATFTSMAAAGGAGTLFTTFSYLGAGLLGAAGVVLGVRRARRTVGGGNAPRPTDAHRQRSYGEWAWRVALALIGFVAIYLLFGRLVAPFVLEVYQSQLYEMRLPGWGEILPVQFARSGLLLLAVAPIVRLWPGRRSSLVLPLGIALFVLLGGFQMVQAYWLPAGLRLAHGLELLADGMVYGWLVTMLIGPVRKEGWL